MPRSSFSRSRGRFDPRLRVGGDMACSALWLIMSVSIHASVWEATGYRSDAYNAAWNVSIHASVWEATLPINIG